MWKKLFRTFPRIIVKFFTQSSRNLKYKGLLKKKKIKKIRYEKFGFFGF